MTFDYTNCEQLTPQTPGTSPTSLTFTQMPNFNYRLRSKDAKAPFDPPQYAFINSSSPSQQAQCIIQFDVPADLPAVVLLYYKLTNFYQNHRRYVKSLDSDQLKGKFVSTKKLNSGDCKPLAVASDGRAIYPCGLVANSFFNGESEHTLPSSPTSPHVLPDTYSALVAKDGTSNYTFSQSGIAWPGEAKKYTSKPDYPLDQIVPPPNWAKKFPNGYSNSTPPPDLRANEHFQNWMRTSGLPTFTKLWGRNDGDSLKKGTYLITVDLSMCISYDEKALY